jgi:hypothetical protein
VAENVIVPLTSTISSASIVVPRAVAGAVAVVAARVVAGAVVVVAARVVAGAVLVVFFWGGEPSSPRVVVGVEASSFP